MSAHLTSERPLQSTGSRGKKVSGTFSFFLGSAAGADCRFEVETRDGFCRPVVIAKGTPALDAASQRS